TSSYCRNSLVSERNSWLSESSTLMRSMPKAASTQSSARITAETIAAQSGNRPIRSSPYARLCSLRGGGAATSSLAPVLVESFVVTTSSFGRWRLGVGPYDAIRWVPDGRNGRSRWRLALLYVRVDVVLVCFSCSRGVRDCQRRRRVTCAAGQYWLWDFCWPRRPCRRRRRRGATFWATWLAP